LAVLKEFPTVFYCPFPVSDNKVIRKIKPEYLFYIVYATLGLTFHPDYAKQSEEKHQLRKYLKTKMNAPAPDWHSHYCHCVFKGVR